MRGKVKKGIVAAAAIVLAAGMAACGSKEAQESVPAAVETVSEEETAEIAVMVGETENAETQSTEEQPEVEQVTADTEGMVIDAAMNSLSIMSPEGEVFFFTYPEEGARVELEDGVLLGEVIKVTYTGSHEEGTAEAVIVTAGTTETALDREAYEFAITAVSFAKFNDLEGLSGLVDYPLYIGIGDNGITVENEGDFNSIEREELIPLGLLADYNLFDLAESDAGIVIGDGKPNIIFSAGEEGYKITGINIPATDHKIG